MTRGAGAAILTGVAFLLPVVGVTSPQPAYKVLAHLDIDTSTRKPSFVPANRMKLLDRGRLIYLGRPIEDRNAVTVLDLADLSIRVLHVPPLPQSSLIPKGGKALQVDGPLFYDSANGVAGILLRGGGSVSGDAAYLEWNLRWGRIERIIPLAPGAGAWWTSVETVGYDPERRECYLEIIRAQGGQTLPCRPSGPYAGTVVGVTDKVREIARFVPHNHMTSKSPYFDLAGNRSMHIDYAECGAEQTSGFLVDLSTGAVRTFALPRVIYGFAFDPGGKLGHVFAEMTGTVFTLDLATGKTMRKREYGRRGHLIDWIWPGTLLLMRNARMHFIDPGTLGEKCSLSPSAFHEGPTHLEGSFILPGRAVVRIFRDLYVLDIPEPPAR